MKTRIIKIILAILLVQLSMTVTAQVSSDSLLKGKRIAFIGDSYVRNHRCPVEETWHYKFAKKHGMEYFNFGRNGNAVAMDRARFGKQMVKRMEEMPDSLDCIVMIAGHNDACLLDSIGGVDGYKEHLSALCEAMIERYPEANILFFTCWNGKDFATNDFHKIVDATEEICGSYSIPVFDAARKGNIFAHSDRFRGIYFQNGGKNDGAHLNARGHDRFLPVAEAFILPYLSH